MTNKQILNIITKYTTNYELTTQNKFNTDLLDSILEHFIDTTDEMLIDEQEILTQIEEVISTNIDYITVEKYEEE